MIFETDELVRLLAALAAGGLVGLEREFRDKAAGFRTLIFISVGAALFTQISTRLGGDADPARIASGIVTGVGFLGAGVILRDAGHVVGLTTAASIWLTAALGTAFGAGYYTLGVSVLVIALLVLWVFPYFEHWVDGLREEFTYEMVCGLDEGKIERLQAEFHKHGLRLSERHLAKESEKMRVRWHASGSPAAHRAVVKALFADVEVTALRF